MNYHSNYNKKIQKALKKMNELRDKLARFIEPNSFQELLGYLDYFGELLSEFSSDYETLETTYEELEAEHFLEARRDTTSDKKAEKVVLVKLREERKVVKEQRVLLYNMKRKFETMKNLCDGIQTLIYYNSKVGV